MSSRNADDVLALVQGILSVPLADGLEFDTDATTMEPIREGDPYSSIRTRAFGTLSTAKIRFHVDINVGDPLWPEPKPVDLPRLLGGNPIPILGYQLELVLAEKIVTALQRGTANTRWRDFVDIANLAEHPIQSEVLRGSIARVADHRDVQLQPLAEVLDGFGQIAQRRWAAWRNKQRLGEWQFVLRSAVELGFCDFVMSARAYGERRLTSTRIRQR